MADIRAEGFDSKEETAKWAYFQLRKYEAMRHLEAQAKEHMELAKEAGSVSDAEKAVRYAERAFMEAHDAYEENMMRLAGRARKLRDSIAQQMELEAVRL
jgi:hypothetical protein